MTKRRLKIIYNYSFNEKNRGSNIQTKEVCVLSHLDGRNTYLKNGLFSRCVSSFGCANTTIPLWCGTKAQLLSARVRSNSGAAHLQWEHKRPSNRTNLSSSWHQNEQHGLVPLCCPGATLLDIQLLFSVYLPLCCSTSGNCVHLPKCPWGISPG